MSFKNSNLKEEIVHTGASITTLNRTLYFETLKIEQGSLSLLSGKTSYAGIGKVAIYLKPSSRTYRFVSMYVPDVNTNILSNAQLYYAGFKNNFDPKDSFLIQSDECKSPCTARITVLLQER